MRRRVVVTGMGGICPLGRDWKTVYTALHSGRSGISNIPELATYKGMDTQLAAVVDDFETPEHYPRKRIRSMGRVSLLATVATEMALEDAGLLMNPVLNDGSTGISYGSSSGSPPAMEVYASTLYTKRTLKGIRAIDYIQFMSHTVAANLSQFFGVRGRIVTTCSACTSGSQGIGYGFEAIQSGKQQVMITGGAEEFHPVDAAVFDVLYATSTRNDAPHLSPRPFDAERDGLVVGEGSATLILEDLEHARRRDAKIYAEVVGYGTNADGKHITNPDADGMQRVIEGALEDADLKPGDIDYINAHGTATEIGDIAESQATSAVFGDRVPISSLKSYIGHTLGACGSIEAWLTIEMTRENWFAPTLNLDQVDPRCGALDYIQHTGRTLAARHVMSNNFAFGGVNTSLIFRRWEEG
jgi:3-oxoacyl-[acyl-carrier-protein] synthase II